MTRQLFPSPSQGALICASGGEEGLLAAAPRSGGAGRQDPALRSRGRTHCLAVSSAAPRPSWGSCSGRRHRACGGRRRPRLGPRNRTSAGLGSSAGCSRPLGWSIPGVCEAGAERLAAAGVWGEGGRQNFHLLRGVTGRRVWCCFCRCCSNPATWKQAPFLPRVLLQL